MLSYWFRPLIPNRRNRTRRAMKVRYRGRLCRPPGKNVLEVGFEELLFVIMFRFGATGDFCLGADYYLLLYLPAVLAALDTKDGTFLGILFD